MGCWPGVLVEAASGGGVGTSCWRFGQRLGTARAGIAGRWPGDGFGASSPALAFRGRITPKMRPQDRDDTGGDVCLLLRQRHA